MTLPTQKELLTAHREALDEKFLRQYPNGKFVIQYRGHNGEMGIKKPWFELHWSPRRPTSHVKYKGISTSFDGNNSRELGIVHNNYQNCSFGKCNSYDSFEKLLAACVRQNVPAELVEAFSERFNNRHLEGFKITSLP